ncbi:MAG: malate synthase G [Actinobacteria bacterium]|uniref:Unannotated protein n=1 Tax=freshwater metagenome TaxID=449393 RepID=A0A6J7RPK8_9ZZZZ|nr:malate synthase G [Actinomycetota bacterium]
MARVANSEVEHIVESPDFLVRAGLRVDPLLVDFLEREALPASSVEPRAFWEGLSGLVAEFAPRNRELLDAREVFQTRIDDWHRQRAGTGHDPIAYRDFLVEIGYIVEEGPQFSVDTESVDVEIAEIAGPQLVVPVTNARYALNAANARWGSLYDALYGTDALGSTPTPGAAYDAQRGALVVAWVRQFLDDVVPLRQGSHTDATRYWVEGDKVLVTLGDQVTGLADPGLLFGYTGEPAAPSSIVLRHHGLGIEVMFDASTAVSGADRAGVSDVILESAVTTIVDFEDSVSTVDGEDKVAAYRNWLGLMTGDLTATLTKGQRTIERRLSPDRVINSATGPQSLRGRALLLVRNVGHLMTTPAVLDESGREIPEGLLDSLVTVMIALSSDRSAVPNSTTGSVYVVKPKMHGPDEVAFAVSVFARVESILGIAENTVKIGIMDEERRTTVNLSECIRAAKSRLAFINTGFLDRTGDEIHTSMLAGPMVRKSEMKAQQWIGAYEDWNVDTGLACGLVGRAQIGKGMWAAPDLMSDMLTQKLGHPKAGANCAWVPSPTAATLHATHYHRVDVKARQSKIASAGRRSSLESLLTIPVSGDPSWSRAEIDAELENNAQGILGYVVRWIDQGVGCSKVPDINHIGLMEDRATCRISSQHLANWLEHAIATPEKVDEVLRAMAVVVDAQNADDPEYVAMAPSFDGVAFRAARALIFDGARQPSGYTEPILHAHRRQLKATTSTEGAVR